ncbi:MAG: transcriptional repressor [Solobacterium sp.]|nr:transcriptional repressor [Solobacterium sp.]
MNGTRYKTKQREELLDYLKTLRGTHVTAGELSEHFRTCENPIGKATVYRTLEQFVEEGIVYKYIIDAGNSACYEYVPEEEHDHHGTCFHCKCEVCGQLFHMHSEELEKMQKELNSRYHFAVDPRRTVFYGVCGNCTASGNGGSR